MSGGSNAVSAWAKAGASAQAESQVTAINCLTEFIVLYPIEKPEGHSACMGDAAHARDSVSARSSSASAAALFHARVRQDERWRPVPRRITILNHLYRAAVYHQRTVRRHQSQRLGKGLRQKQSIERVGVVQRQLGHRCCVTRRNGQLTKAAVIDGSREDLGIPFNLAQLRLDRDFPNGGGRYIHRFCACQIRAGGGLELTAASHRPDEHMGIDEQTHQRPSNCANTSSGNGRSKSLPTFTLPLSTPKRILRGGVTRLVSRATGFPPRAMITSFPAAACSTSLDSCVLAS